MKINNFYFYLASEEAPENVSLHGHKKKKKNKSQQEVSVDDAGKTNEDLI